MAESKAVLITGCSSGIGHATAARLADEGWTVYATARNADKLTELAEKLRHVRETGVELLATGNPGCHMQLAAGARLAGLRLRVVHPVELLDDSYRRAGLYDGEGGQT